MAMRVLIVGSLHFDGSKAVKPGFESACRDLGAALATRGHEVVVGSASEKTADRYVLEGIGSVAGDHRVFVYRPSAHDSLDKFVRLGLGSNVLLSYHRAEGTTWATGRSSQIQVSDGVIVIGGGRSTLEVRYMAPVLGKPVVAIASFGGAAAQFEESPTREVSNGQEIRVVRGPWSSRLPEEVLNLLEDMWLRGSALRSATPNATGPVFEHRVPVSKAEELPISLPREYEKLREPQTGFFADLAMRCTEYDKNVFLMMPFYDHEHLTAIDKTIRGALDRRGLVAHRADDRTYPKDRNLWDNICTYMFGCKYGIAVLENTIVQEFNPNVALEYGFMRALGKECLLLKEQRFKPRADIMGTLAEEFDIFFPEKTVGECMERWLKDIRP